MKWARVIFRHLIYSVVLIYSLTGLAYAQAWTELLPGGGPPSERISPTSVYDSTANRMVVFGGSAPGSVLFSDVWALKTANGLGGTPDWLPLSPSAGPSARVFHSAIHDTVNNRMTIFGEDGARV